VLGAVVAALLASQAGRVRAALAEVELFRVKDVEVEGARYVSAAEVTGALRLSPTASVWDDRAPLEARVSGHPLVSSARIGRRLPSTLVVRIDEREPVALLATPTLEPVDARGRTLPLDPARHRLDLPLLVVPDRALGEEGAHESGAGEPGRVPRPVRVLAGEIARLGEAEPSFMGMVSELTWIRYDEAAARWGDPGVVIRFRPPLSPRRVREAMSVLADATARRPERAVELVDLRWADQVVVRYGGRGSS
jgi:hypothetical protein